MTGPQPQPPERWDPSQPTWPAVPSGEWVQPRPQPPTLGDPSVPTVWEGRSEDLVSTAVGGRGAARYRLTPWYLYWETGYLTTNGQQVPLFMVFDVDIRQSITQKARGVGDVVIQAGQYSCTITSIRAPQQFRDVLMRTVHQAVAHHRSQTNTSTHLIANLPPPQPIAPPAPTRPIESAPTRTSSDEIFAQLRQLGELRDAGIVTPEEFEAKKAELLARL